MAGRAGRRVSDFNDERPPEPPPPLPGVSQRSRLSSEGGRGRPEHNIPDEGLSGIVAPVRAKQPRESSPTPATRLPGGRDGRPDRSQSASRRASSVGRNGQRDSPRGRQSPPGARSGRPTPPLPPSASKASKSPSSAGEQRRSSLRPASAKSPPPPPSYAGEERERRSASRDERRQSRSSEQRASISGLSGIQPTSSPSGGGSQKGSPGKTNSPQRRSSVSDRRSSLIDRKLLVAEPPLLAGDTPVDPEDFAETADSGFYQETTDDDRSWANRASLGSVATPTEAPTPIASHSPPMGGGFEFGTWPGLGHPVAFPGTMVPGFVAPIPGFLSPPRFGAGRGAPRALVPPLPLGSAVDLAAMARGGMKSPLGSPTPPIPPFPMHSLSVDSSVLSIAPSSPLRTPSTEFRAVPPPLAAVPPPLAMVQLAQPAWAPGSPKGALRSGRARSSSPMRMYSRPSSPMRTESRTFGEEGATLAAPSEQLEAGSKAPMAIPMQGSAARLPMSFPQLRAPQGVRSLSPRPASPGPARRSSSPQGVRPPAMLSANLKPFHWVKPGQMTMPAPPAPLRRPAMPVNAAFAPPMLAARSISPMQRSPRGFAWSTPVRGGGMMRVGSPLRNGVMSPPRTPPRSPTPGSPNRAVVVPNSPAGMLSYAGAGARQNMYASSDSLDFPSGPSRLLPEQEQETAYPRSPTGSPRLDADEPIRPNLKIQPETLRPNLKIQPSMKAGSMQQAEEDFMRRWRDLQSTDGEDEPEAFLADSPTSGKAALADPAAAVVTDNVFEAAGKRRGSRQRIRPGQPAQRRVGR